MINRYAYEDITVGMSESFSVTITEAMMKAFRELSGDENPLHTDAAYAAGKGYASPVCYGMLTASFLSTLAGVYLPGEKSLIHKVDTEFVAPVFPGDSLEITGTVHKKMDEFKTIALKVRMTNQKQELVCRATMRIGML